MPCAPEELKHVPLFELLDEEELAVLAAQVDIKHFAARQRIFKIGDPGNRAYIMMSGKVRVTTVDEDQQEVLIEEPPHGDSLGLRRCSIRRRTSPMRWRWKRRCAWSWTGTTSPSC